MRGIKSGTVSCRSPQAGTLTLKEKDAIGLLQQDLPVVERPFQNLAATSNNLISEDRLLEFGKSLENRGIMRRYAAVLRHMNAGYTHNAMTVWKFPDNETALSGIDAFIRESAVSHLYRRTIHPGKWEYPLFAMIHAKSNSELTDVIRRLSQKSGIADYQVLKSLRELKKLRVVYFSANFEKWHKKMN